MSNTFSRSSRERTLDDRPALLFHVGRDLRAGVLEEMRRNGALRCMLCASHSHALVKVERDRPDLVVLDATHTDPPPDVAVRELLEAKRNRRIAFVVLSNDPADRHPAFANCLGVILPRATKPFDILLHAKALLRRGQSGGLNLQRDFGSFGLDESSLSVNFNGRSARLTRHGYLLFAVLAEKPGYVWSRSELVDLVWSPGAPIGARTVTAAIKGVRRTLAEVGARDSIEAHIGEGYSFNLDRLSSGKDSS